MASDSATELSRRLQRLRAVGDPLADGAVAEAVGGASEGNRLLDRAIRHGPDACTPPAARALVENSRRIGWADEASLARGSGAYLAIGANWIGLALGPGSLAHTYSSPSIAAVLVETANLSRMARRRLLETGAWNVATALPNGLIPGGEGYRQNLQVRLLHARVRYGLLHKGWDVAARGVPINQLELIRTWLDFTYVPFGALGTLGIDFSNAEVRDLYHLWQVAAHLIGIDRDIVRSMTDQASARVVLDAIHALEGPPTTDSRLLVAAMLDAMGDLLAPGLGVSPKIARMLSAAVLRRFYGRDLAGKLGVPWNPAALALPVIAQANRLRRCRERRDPALRQVQNRKAIDVLANREAIFAGPTTYERAAFENPGLGPPATHDA